MKPLNSFPKHKRKKIKYIRTKFRIRTGLQKFQIYSKIYREADEKLITQKVDELVHELRKEIFQKYKIQLKYFSVQTPTLYGDLEQDLLTIYIVVYNKK